MKVYIVIYEKSGVQFTYVDSFVDETKAQEIVDSFMEEDMTAWIVPTNLVQ